MRNVHHNREASIYVGGINDHVTEEILLELFMQAGPVVSVNLPRDKVTNRSSGHAFVEFKTEQDAEYAYTIMNGISLFGNPIKLSPTTISRPDNEIDVGARLYIGNLADDVDDLTLHKCFKVFGNIQTSRVAKDPATGKSLGHGFVSYDSFDAADNAKKQMNGQYVSGQPITVSYAYKAGTKRGEQHGDASERRTAPSMAAAAKLKKLQKKVGVLPVSDKNQI